MTFLDIIPVLLVAAVVYTAYVLYSKRSKYTKWLNENKAKHEYQTINLDTLIKIYGAIGGNSFAWDYSGEHPRRPHLLWYRVQDADARYPVRCYQYFLIDMPWIACVRFRMWERKFIKERDVANQEVARCKNATNDVLQDVQRKLDAQIQHNCQQMKEVAIQQGEVISRLSEFEKDYIKSQITQVC